MNRLILLLTIFFFFLNFQTADAVVAIKSVGEKTSEVKVSKNDLKKNTRQLKLKNKKNKRVAKKLKRFQQRWEKQNRKKKRFFGGITDEPKFKLGIILFAAGLVVRILGVLPLVGWVTGFLAWTLVVVGIALMLWTLLENL